MRIPGSKGKQRADPYDPDRDKNQNQAEDPQSPSPQPSHDEMMAEVEEAEATIMPESPSQGAQKSSSAESAFSLPTFPVNWHTPNPREGWAHTPADCICDCTKKAYIVFNGYKRGIFNTSTSKSQRSSFNDAIKGFPGARFRGYHSLQDAEHAFASAKRANLLGNVPPQWWNHHFVTLPLTPCPENDNSTTPRRDASTPNQTPRTPVINRYTSSSQTTSRSTPSATCMSRTPSTPTPNTPRTPSVAAPTPYRFTPPAQSPAIKQEEPDTPTARRALYTPTPSPNLAAELFVENDECSHRSDVCRCNRPPQSPSPQPRSLGRFSKQSAPTGGSDIGRRRARVMECFPAPAYSDAPPAYTPSADPRYIPTVYSRRPVLPTITATITVSDSPPSPPVAGLSRASASAQAHRSPTNDDDTYWVVIIGNHPGVYRGRTTAARNAGTSARVVMFECLEGCRSANRIFVEQYRLRVVRRLIPVNIPFPFTSAQQRQSTQQEEDVWYVVPSGPEPGVYFGRTAALRAASFAAGQMVQVDDEDDAYDLFVNYYMSYRIQDYN
ncbi:hypothetical protein NP233_g8792 [Leucocoprinus birnbaumii]|uniref:Ribonuclease H1 N-terminal domain-containing protein n=1 Tax=Leucocoprinus birnbaumii TaxID=56174 RepID=A0AAD5VP30_9AGAR|nr:hypothetical protein NP233_g8792 [Leucocoprinus birnbaumii]